MVPSTAQEKPKDSDQFEWVTIEQSGELVYEAPESIAAEPPPINKQQSQSSSSSPSSSVQTMSPIPAHSLAAFGLFLRLPGYAEVLLKERKHAQCLLRLVLGVTDDGEGSKFPHLHFCCQSARCRSEVSHCFTLADVCLLLSPVTLETVSHRPEVGGGTVGWMECFGGLHHRRTQSIVGYIESALMSIENEAKLPPNQCL